jgi:peptide-methionine (S)-S-oxide reductase
MTTSTQQNPPTRRRWFSAAAFALAAAIPVLGLALSQTASVAQEKAVIIPAPAVELTETGTTAKAVFAGGCFWGVQGVFQRVVGVKSAISGYAGGDASTANYSAIGTGTTGHAETVEIVYDPSIVSYGDLLQVYFSVVHNPTQLNYQGPDHGTQYRSTVFFQSEEEKAVVEAYVAQLDAAGVYGDPIVTTLEPYTVFYAAEDYHQDFLTVNPTWPYIVYHDLPKIEALKEIFPALYQDDPVLVSELQ